MKPIVIISISSLAFLLVNVKSEQANSSSVKWKKHTIHQFERGTVLSVTAGDYNKDGKMDVITSCNGKVYLFTAPSWKPTIIHTMPSAKQKAISSVSIDVDKDGDLDWLGGDAHAGAIWLENPNRSGVEWKARTVNGQLGGIHSIILADINKDGSDDVIINNFKNEGKLANSAMWYELPQKPTDESPWKPNVFANGDAKGGSHYFGFGDIDGDGWGEIAIAAKGKPFDNGNWFAYWKNPGAENLTSPWEKTPLLEDEIGATNILIKDINGDGKNDCFISNGHGVGIFWLEAPKWKKHDIDTTIESPHSLTTADYDNDGDIDLASCAFGSKRLSVYYNDGKGNFTQAKQDEDQQSYDLHTFDIDGDGDPDLLNAGRGNKNVAWYENPAK